MLTNHLKLFFRNIRRNKGTFLINTLGLGVGIASFLVLAVYVYNDLTYNHFNENLANIYRVQELYDAGTSTATKGPLLPEMQKQIPEIVNGTRIFDWDGYRLAYGDHAFLENVYYVDQGFFSVFTFPFVEGGASGALEEKYSAVISRRFAEKYFGSDPALGEQLQIGFSGTFLTVTGVVDIPENSSVKFDIVTSYTTGESISPWIKEVHDWYNTFSETYVVLQEGIEPSDLEAKLAHIVKTRFLPEGENTTRIGLLPFSRYHAAEESNQTLIIILALIALGILSIALVNFINLTIVNTLSRTREMGVKKVFGASRRHVTQQIMVESFALGAIALLLGFVLFNSFLLPAFNALFETKFSVGSFDPYFLAFTLLVVWFVIGICSGSIPSLLWSRSKPVENLQGKISSGHHRGAFSRHASIVIQFVIAIALISATVVIREQIDFMLNKNPKFDNEHTVVVQTDYWQHQDVEAASGKLGVLSHELAASPYVVSVNFTGSIPGDYDENYNTFYPQAESLVPDISLRKSYVGQNYFNTLGIEVLSGHGFDREPTALQGAAVLNRTAMQRLGFDKAEGQLLVEGREGGTQYRIVGMIDDFSYQGVQRPTEPLAHFFTEQENLMEWDYLTVRAKRGSTPQLIEMIEQKWEALLPEVTLTHFLADGKLNDYYREYERVNTLITGFSVLAVLLSCMGLFALASYAMARRTREIGIRKVNGATVRELLTMLNTDFLKWVFLAFVIAVPLAWYTMREWLQGFAYKTEIDWWVFAVSGGLAFIIALLTVSWQSFRATRVNPVEVLKEI